MESMGCVSTVTTEIDTIQLMDVHFMPLLTDMA